MLNPTQFQAKEEKVQVADDSLSKVDPLSEMNPLSEASSLFSEASSSLSRWETLEENKPEICPPNMQGETQ